MSDDQCDYESIKNAADVCDYVSKHCDANYINFYVLHFCSFDQRAYLTIPVFIILIFICFRVLSSTANVYLSASLTFISEKLAISQNLAGITFLAFGNGAPDVISSIVASDPTENANINFAIGALTGGGIFITSLVFSLVIYYGVEVKVQKHLFLRDVCFYILALVLLFIFSINETINLVESILFLMLYFV